MSDTELEAYNWRYFEQAKLDYNNLKAQLDNHELTEEEKQSLLQTIRKANMKMCKELRFAVCGGWLY